MPFVTGRRPIDEASFPGLGSSDKVALIVGGSSAAENRAYLLYRLSGIESFDRCEVRVSLSLGDEPVPQWHDRVIPPMSFEHDGEVTKLVSVDAVSAGNRCLVVAIPPADLDEKNFSFEHLFVQEVRAAIVLFVDGAAVSASTMMIDACDARRSGSLYQRVLDRVIGHVAATHPLFPVLLIGSEKADLYMQALVADIVRKRRYLTDPGWLLRVGIYLELLTCLGIADAVRNDVDILSADERRAYETSEVFAPIRKALNVERWREVWQTRPGSTPLMNLLAKRKATIAFIEAHHEDLKEAIRLAGPNDHNAQETWHRVFRDAERAVLRKTQAAFSELASFPAIAQDFILWHQQGKFHGFSFPAVTSWFGDQDGLFAAACKQYRSSMNHVADWAKREGLMDYAGAECIPESISILKALIDGKHVRLAELQRRDGYTASFDLPSEVPAISTRDAVVALFRGVSIFRVLTDDEIETLASTARPIELGPVERIIVQGREGTSLFVVASGNLEVMVRQADGVDLPIAILGPGSVFGEMSLLTGQRRSATVRSIESALVYEVGHQQIAPILQSRPAAVNELAAIMEPRLRATDGARQTYEEQHDVVSLGQKIRSFLFH